MENLNGDSRALTERLEDTNYLTRLFSRVEDRYKSYPNEVSNLCFEIDNYYNSAKTNGNIQQLSGNHFSFFVNGSLANILEQNQKTAKNMPQGYGMYEVDKIRNLSHLPENVLVLLFSDHKMIDVVLNSEDPKSIIYTITATYPSVGLTIANRINQKYESINASEEYNGLIQRMGEIENRYLYNTKYRNAHPEDYAGIEKEYYSLQKRRSVLDSEQRKLKELFTYTLDVSSIVDVHRAKFELEIDNLEYENHMQR